MYRITHENSKHLYEIETTDKEGNIITIQVEANNRAQAAKKAEKEGYTVRSVNMVG